MGEEKRTLSLLLFVDPLASLVPLIRYYALIKNSKNILGYTL